MRINELLRIQYNDTLNPKLWDGEQLNAEVHQKLTEISDAFIEYIDLVDMQIVDVILTGSNANYNWTSVSDIDLHVVVNMQDLKQRCPDITEDFFRDKKIIWNDNHALNIYGHDVELYAQDADEQHIASGVYSLHQNRWVTEPEHNPPTVDNAAIEAKANQFQFEIDDLIDVQANQDEIQKMKTRIRNLRQSGLESAGEFSTENLVFKVLRNSGHLNKLSNYSRRALNKKLSLPSDVHSKE